MWRHCYIKGIAGFPGQCNTLSGGMAVTGWTSDSSPTGMAGAVWTAANQFHLNFHQVITNTINTADGADGADGAAASARGKGRGDSHAWVHGVSGEVTSVPAGWEQRTMMYYSGQGMNAAVDGWGTTLRQAHNTTKKDAEDPFLQTVSYWTDNGKSTLPRTLARTVRFLVRLLVLYASSYACSYCTLPRTLVYDGLAPSLLLETSNGVGWCCTTAPRLHYPPPPARLPALLHTAHADDEWKDEA